MVYPSLAHTAKFMADGGTGRRYPGRKSWVERERKSWRAWGAHPESKQLPGSCGGAWRRAGHGEVLTAAFLPELGKTDVAGARDD
jgi:hypothetical protein